MLLDLNAYSLGKYLEDCQANRPEIVAEVQQALSRDGTYRKRTKDARNKNCDLSVYIDQSMVLHIITVRNETCQTCNGSGMREIPFDAISSRIAAGFRCMDCKGEKELKNKKTEHSFTLTDQDFADINYGRQFLAQRAYAAAPQGAEAWVQRLNSPNPQDRLAACIWLDQNYVRVGAFFQDIMPMLKKARLQDSDAKKKIMVWQFWAGKDMPNERDRSYYRVYADAKSGKITKKGFYR